MSSPSRWQPPNVHYPPPPAKKKPVLKIVLWSTLAAFVFCFGGLATIGAFLDSPDQPAASTKAAGNEAAQPLLDVPSSSPAADAAAETPTSRPATTRPTPATRPTTARPATTEPKATSTGRATPKPKPTTTKPKPKPKPTPKPTTAAPKKTVTPGAFCSPQGATGVSKKGKPYRCIKKSGEDRARWRAA